MEKTLVEHGRVLKAQDKSAAEAAISATRIAMNGSDHDQLKQATENLGQAAAMIEKAASESARTADGRGSNPSEKSREADVQDAEFEEVGDGKKSA